MRRFASQSGFDKMKILIAPNAFKSTLTATEAADIIERGMKAVIPEAETIRMPVSDGGDGFTEVILSNSGGEDFGNYAVLPDKTVIIETAKLCGIAGYEGKNNALTANSEPLGKAFLQVLDSGYRKFIIGLGGSRTTDCGKGFAEALGMRFTDKNGDEVSPGGIGLAEKELDGFCFAVKTNKNNLPLEICKQTCREDLFKAVKETILEWNKHYAYRTYSDLG
jgi:glycerate kinase